ncbi:hypothetical protein NKG94_38625 [Micromonospora sp. M12]
MSTGVSAALEGRQAAQHATTSVPPRRPDVAGLPRLRRCPGRPAHRAPVAQRRLVRLRHDIYADARLERDHALACRAALLRLPPGW